MKQDYYFTSESVSEGHPDKVCDQISDAILDACLALDDKAHVAIECFVAEQKLLIGGEVKFSSSSIVKPDMQAIARNVIRSIGYTNPELGFSADEVVIHDWVQAQSEDINQAVNQDEVGAGDQGLMFGFATKETPDFLPLPISLAHALVKRASILRKKGDFKHARPDMKSQVTVHYQPNRIVIDHVVMSIQHDEHYDQVAFETFVKTKVIQPVLEAYGYGEARLISINPSGKFVIGGPKGDTGLTGRKIIVDTYGGYARHGGGAFSGKDPTKVDRSAAYLARYIAKHVVASGIADKVEVQLAYIIGVAKPVSISLFTFDTLAKPYSEKQVLQAIEQTFFFKPAEIIDQFHLTRPTFSYRDLAAYGHVGRHDLHVPWEQLDRLEILLNYLKKSL
jgi:S-adenosylmethionine synthetase